MTLYAVTEYRDHAKHFGAEWLRGVWRLGGMLKETIEHRGGRPRKTLTQGEGLLPDSLSWNQSSRYQKVHNVEEPVLEEYVTDLVSTTIDELPTIAGLMRVWRDTQRGGVEIPSDIDPDNPPFVELDSATSWLERQPECDVVPLDPPVGPVGCGVDTPWLFGDGLNFGDKKYGETYQKVALWTRYKPKTLWTAAWVASRVETSRRREVLSWGHHAEVAKFDAEDQDAWLDTAVSQGWTIQQLRVAIRGDNPTPTFPAGTYGVIYADPPWQYEFSRSLEPDCGPNSLSTVVKAAEGVDWRGVSYQAALDRTGSGGADGLTPHGESESHNTPWSEATTQDLWC